MGDIATALGLPPLLHAKDPGAEKSQGIKAPWELLCCLLEDTSGMAALAKPTLQTQVALVPLVPPGAKAQS